MGYHRLSVLFPRGRVYVLVLQEEHAAAKAAEEEAAKNAALEAAEAARKAEALAAETRSELDTALGRAARSEDKKMRVMFILSTQGGRILASGTGTGANGIIEMAGGVNAVSSFEGYKPLSDEAASAAAPDVILMMDRSGDHASTDAELFGLPALSVTPAAATRNVVRMDGLFLLGFGPRTAKAVTALNRALYPT